MNLETIRSPLLRIEGQTIEMVPGKSTQNHNTYMKMDDGLYSELKQKIKSKTAKSISDFPLYSDMSVTITNIREVETFAEKTAIYHGNKRIKRIPNIIAMKGEIAESGDTIFLSLSPRGAHGFTKNTDGESKRNLKYSPNSTYTVAYDTNEEDIENLDLMNDMVDIPDDSDDAFEQSPARGLPVMSYYRVAVDTTSYYLERMFEGDTEAAEDYILSVFAYINPPFNEFNAHMYVNYIRLWPDDNDGYLSISLRDLLSEFGMRWSNKGNPEYSIPRHTQVILSLLRDSNAIGWGSLNAICNKRSGSAAYQGSSSLFSNSLIIAHELGHNFGSVHTWLYDPPIEECTIMSYCTRENSFFFHSRVIDKFNSLRSWENDNCVPLTHPDMTEGSCEAPAVTVTDTTATTASLSWNNTEAESYDVYYRRTDSKLYRTAATGLTDTSFEITDLTENSIYDIRVFSRCADGSMPGDTITVTMGDVGDFCSTPSVNVTNKSENSISISWDSTNADSYTIKYKAYGSDSLQTVAELTKTNYVISGLTDDTLYVIYVYSNCSNGMTPYDTVTTKTDEAQNSCTAPEINVTDTSTNSISILWNDTGAANYTLYYKTESEFTWSDESDLTDSTFTITGLTANTTYNLAVMSHCPDGSNPYEMTEATTDGSGGDGLTLDEVLGDYIRKPVENNLDEGTIYEVGSKIEWGVDGGPKWTLIPDLENNRFVTTTDYPYGSGKYFTLVVSGTTVTGFNFEGDFWTKR